VGLRNHIAIIPSVSCAATVALKIASQVNDAVAIMNNTGCDEIDADVVQTTRTLVGIGKNPNVAGCLIVGLGCEVVSAEKIEAEIGNKGKLVERIVIQGIGGTSSAIERGVSIVKKMLEAISGIERAPFDLSFLQLGMECGGSDATSGLAANPALGFASDKIVASGGTSILAETPELIGGEHLLKKRAINVNIEKKIDSIVKNYEEKLKAAGEDFIGKQPGPGNIEGGLTTIEEKSLGCIAKAGSSKIQGVLEYSEAPVGNGLYIMDTPGNDIESVTALAGGGCQVVCFTTGRGTPVG